MYTAASGHQQRWRQKQRCYGSGSGDAALAVAAAAAAVLPARDAPRIEIKCAFLGPTATRCCSCYRIQTISKTVHRPTYIA